MKGFVEKIADTESALGKLLKSVEGGTETAGRAVDLYSKLGPLLGAPPLPHPFK